MLSFVNPFSEDSENQVGSLSENIVKNRYPAIIPRKSVDPENKYTFFKVNSVFTEFH